MLKNNQYRKNVYVTLSFLLIFWVCFPVQSQSTPSPLVEVKRKLGDHTPGIVGAIDQQNPGSFPSFSPLIRGLGKTRQDIKLPDYTTKKIEDITVEDHLFSVLEHKNGSLISKYYLSKNVITGYILHDFLPVTYQPNEAFLLQIKSFPKGCGEYLSSRTLPPTQKFDCYKQEHNNYVEEYIFEIVMEPHYVERILIVDAFYPKVLEQHAKTEVNRILDVVLSK